MNVLGIDFSTRAIDCVLLRPNDSAEWWRYALFPRGAEWAPAQAAGTILPRLYSDGIVLRWATGEYAVPLVVLERPYCRSFRTATALYEVRGAILGWLGGRVTVLSLPPQEWKQEFCGNPKASKADVRARATALVPFTDGHDWPQDAWDAYGIAWAGRELCQRAAEAQVGSEQASGG